MLLFHEVIRKICGRKVLRVDPSNTADARLVRTMDRVAGTAMRETQRNPVIRSRPNEVGNDVEKYGKSAIADEPGLDLVSMRRSIGYPDILVRVDASR